MKRQDIPETSQPTQEWVWPLLKNNFVIMVVAAVLIVVGFVLMAGQASDTQTYNPDIFSSRRIVVGPLLSFIGYVLMGIAIIVKPKQR